MAPAVSNITRFKTMKRIKIFKIILNCSFAVIALAMMIKVAIVFVYI
jgi:hypothetical protein